MKPLVITFLQQLYRQDKKLFLLVALYACGILYYCSRQREEFPFLLYGMYSLKEEPKSYYVTYALYNGDKELSFSNFSDAKKELITTTLSNAVALYDIGQLDAQQQMDLREWLYMFFTGKFEGFGRHTPDIYRVICTYNENGQPIIIKKELLFPE